MENPNIPTEEVVSMSPFKHMVMTIGTLPTAFTESLTYYEALAYFVQELNKLIKVVDQNAEATKELQQLYIQLKQYVDDYFSDLNIQQEINNKLDEMAEGGELAGIIAQFLEVAPVFAYNTIAAMAAADNLSDGCIAKVLGKTDPDTGDGSFYRIRTRTESDTPDGLNLVAITGDSTIIAQIIPDKIGDLANLTTNNKTNIVSAINEINDKNFDAFTLIENPIDFPLLMTKKSDGTNDGNNQGLTVKFNPDGTPNTIYQWVDYTAYSKLYITTCGSRTDGTGWSTSVLSSGVDQIPYSHGSAISSKDSYILVGETGDKTYGKINPLTGTYTIEDLAEYLPDSELYIVAIIWDSISQTYNLCMSDNVTHYILDEDFTLLRTYSYVANGLDFTSSYGFQGYDYFNGLEYRVMSMTSGRNIGLVIDTVNGKVIKTFKLSAIIGEVESICVKDNIALFSYNSADAYCDLINHFYVTEAYIGGYPDNNIKLLQDYSPVLHHTEVKQGILAEGSVDTSLNIYFKNDYALTDIVRYIGDGSSANPIKSGSALGTIIALLNIINKSTTVKVIFNQSTNTDDIGLRLTTKLANIKEIDLDCNTYSGNMVHLWLVGIAPAIRLRKINITTTNNTRRENKITLAGNTGGVILYNATTTPTFDINTNSYIRLVSGSFASTSNSNLSENVFVATTANINSFFSSTGTITMTNNNTTD